MRSARAILAATRAAALALALAPPLALAPARAAGNAQAPMWRFEAVLPPQQPGESSAQHEARFPVSLGRIGDIEFWAPNRGVLITAGNPPTIPPGVWAYNGTGWHELASECGASDGRIAWAGPDEFWTVSDGRPGQVSSERPPPLEDNTLCHFKNGQIAGSYASLAFRADSYQAMHGAACLSPSDCWFAGELQPEAEPGASTRGAFQLHWNGTSVAAEAYPAEHAIADMRQFGRYLFQSVRLGAEDHLLESESPSAPPDLHLITPVGVQPTFISLTPGVPRYAPGERPYALEAMHLAADEEGLWGAANPVSPAPAESAPGEVTLLRYAGGSWSQVLGFSTDPLPSNPFTQPGRAEREQETVTSLAAEPGAAAAWLGLTSLENAAASRRGAAGAMVARVSAGGEVSERQTLPAAGEGIGLKGAADHISCPDSHDCWLATDQGWLFHYADEAHRRLPQDTDPSFTGVITFRPHDAGIPVVVPDAPPVDDSGLLGEARQSLVPPVEVPAATSELRIPVALLSHLRTRLVHGTTLELRFHLAAKARVRLIAKRRRRVVASTPMHTFAAGERRLTLLLSRRSWPTKLDLQTHALGALPTTSTRSPGTNTVGTGFAVLPRVPSFAQAGTLP
jgi:hypothetical protein